MLKFNHFKTLLQELKVFDQYMPILLSNGFDDWDSVVELNEEILNQIGFFFFSPFYNIFSLKGIKNQVIIKEILGCLQSANSYEIKLHENQEQKVYLILGNLLNTIKM